MAGETGQVVILSLCAGGCDFETGLCTWTNARSGDQFDWLIGHGQTNSQYTGPSYDHTLATQAGNIITKITFVAAVVS